MRLSAHSTSSTCLRRAALALALALALVLPLAPSAQAASFSIACGDIVGLIAAISTANSNGQPDTIDLAAGCVYQVSVPDNSVNAFPQIVVDISPDNTLTINGNGATIERANSRGDLRFFQVSGDSARATLILNDLTLRNGSISQGGGGAILVFDAALELQNVTFSNNSADEGGAVAGFYSQMTAAGTTFVNNTAGSGGAMFAFYPSLEIGQSTFDANSATDPQGRGGGALYALSPLGIIDSSTFSGNASAETGGAISFGEDGSSEFEILNSTISGNSAAGSGGGISNSASLLLSSTTISANTADSDGDGAGDGGGVAGLVGSGGSLIAGNFDTPSNGGPGALYPDVESGPFSLGYNLVGDLGAADFPLNTAGDQYGDPSGTTTPDPAALESATAIDPLLGPLGQNGGPTQTQALQPGSPARDAGDPDACPPTDQRGVARPLGPACDIGAFEASVVVLAPEIAVLDDAAAPIADGAATPVDFGSTTVGTAVTRTFTIQNSGTASLTLASLSLPAGFSLAGAFPTSVAPGASATFGLRLDAALAGTFAGSVAFDTNDADENPFDFAITGTVAPPPQAPSFQAMLPLVTVQRAAPDLAITSMTISPAEQQYAAGQPVQVTIVVTNRGSAPASPFWVDLYVSPARTPQVNDLWHNVCGMTPCVGVAWGVDRSLAAGESITLTTTAGYDGRRSYWPGWLPAGTTTLYALADSWNTTGTAGAVAESDEANNLAQIGGLLVTGSNPPLAPWQPASQSAPAPGLPARPAPYSEE